MCGGWVSAWAWAAWRTRCVAHCAPACRLRVAQTGSALVCAPVPAHVPVPVLAHVPGCSWVFLGVPGCSWVYLRVPSAATVGFMACYPPPPPPPPPPTLTQVVGVTGRELASVCVCAAVEIQAQGYGRARSWRGAYGRGVARTVWCTRMRGDRGQRAHGARRWPCASDGCPPPAITLPQQLAPVPITTTCQPRGRGGKEGTHATPP